eukprot:6567663-Prorocentrum_lima.AAC.1
MKFRAVSVDAGRDRVKNDQPVVCLVGFPRDSKRKELEKWADDMLESIGAKSMTSAHFAPNLR